MISLLFELAHALWTFRNDVLHGHTTEENETKARGKMQDKIKAAYEAYKSDKFIVLNNCHYLFSKPLHPEVKSRS